MTRFERFTVRRWATVVGVLMLGITVNSTAAAQLALGRDYANVQPPQPTGDKNKIEVIEFFSYGCHSCNDFRPFFAPWADKQPSDVQVVRVPVSLGHPQWEPLIRAYYSLEISGDLKRLDKALFDAIHRDRRELMSDADIIKWAGQQGLDTAKFTSLMKSFSVVSKAAEADMMAKRYKINQTPTVVIDGKYRLTTNKSFAEWTPLLDQLVAKARAEKAR